MRHIFLSSTKKTGMTPTLTINMSGSIKSITSLCETYIPTYYLILLGLTCLQGLIFIMLIGSWLAWPSKAKKKNKVVTMHDVSLLHEIEHEGKFLNYYRKSIDQLAEEGTPIIVVSESAKQDALTYSNLKKEQLYAIHNGINFDQFFKKEEERKEGHFK